MAKLIDEYIAEGIALVKTEKIPIAHAAKRIIEKYQIQDFTVNALRKRITTGINNQRWNNPYDISDFEVECAKKGINPEDVTGYWAKGEYFSIHVSNNQSDESTLLSQIQHILDTYKPSVVVVPMATEISVQKALKIVISDTHVGMEANENNHSIFKYEYNEDVFKSNLDHVLKSIKKEYHTHGRFEKVYLQHLGDSMDGWNATTTRGGHRLPQNLSNTGQFTVFVFGYLNYVEQVVAMNIADEINIVMIVNCNHAGDIGALAAITIKGILERVYDPERVKVVIQYEFIDNYEYGDHTFIMTHGKDKEHMRNGLPKNLDAKTTNYINSYIDHYEIATRYIHFEKGDLHCSNVERSKKFDYRNFMSFAPPSGWVQTNFMDSYSGYSIQVVPKHSGEISHCDYVFEFKKAKRIT